MPSRIEPSSPHSSDLALVDATLRGDRVAAEAFAERMLCVHRILHALNRRRNRPLDDHELLDAVQDALAVLWRKRRTFRGLARLETWAYRVAVLEWTAAVRRKKSRWLRPADVIVHGREEPSAFDATVGESGGALAVAFLDRLAPPDADVIRLKHFDDRTFEDIGRALEVSPNTAKYWYYRGVAKLRQWMRPHVRRGLE